MNKYIIEPFTGVGKVKLGMSREEVRNIMGQDFINTKLDNTGAECYLNGIFRINYDKNNLVSFIEIPNGTRDFYQVFFNEVDIFGTPAKELVSYMKKFSKYRDTDDAKLGYTYDFDDIGISLWRSNVFEEETLQEEWFKQLTPERQEEELRWDYFESVSIWSKGYYDKI